MPTSSAPEEWALRSRSFGAVASAYDRARPSYPEELARDVVAMLPGPDVVEVGAGTGKATALFAAAGLHLTCVEPDPGMAAVLKEKLPEIDVVPSSFEDWNPSRHYDGLLAAQSWHWTNPETRYAKAAAALREGGVLALFWNHLAWRRTPIRAAIDDVYRRHGIGATDANSPPPTNPSGISDTSLRDELSKLPTFSDVEVRDYPWARRYTAREWCDYLATTSDHLILDADARNALLADVAKVIDESGGVIEIPGRCELYLARRAGDVSGVASAGASG